jgi:hypothetical protein
MLNVPSLDLTPGGAHTIKRILEKITFCLEEYYSIDNALSLDSTLQQAQSISSISRSKTNCKRYTSFEGELDHLGEP